MINMHGHYRHRHNSHHCNQHHYQNHCHQQYHLHHRYLHHSDIRQNSFIANHYGLQVIILTSKPRFNVKSVYCVMARLGGMDNNSPGNCYYL